jgi:short subunit dehydrogenase-like uncharacterized protein
MRQRKNWMLYGAHGHTGCLIPDHAVRRGHLPLEDGGPVRAALSEVGCVLVAAGPFHQTGSAMPPSWRRNRAERPTTVSASLP